MGYVALKDALRMVRRKVLEYVNLAKAGKTVKVLYPQTGTTYTLVVDETGMRLASASGREHKTTIDELTKLYWLDFHFSVEDEGERPRRKK